MAANPPPPELDLAELLLDWQNVLKAEGKAKPTLENYAIGVTLYIRWCTEQGETPRVDRKLVTEWVVALQARGLEATTVRARQMAVRRFSAWLDGEPGIEYSDQLLGLKPPKLAEKLIQPLTDKELKLMLLACDGSALRDRRDEAVLRLMTETGLRAGEVVALTVSDVNTSARVVSIRKAKSGRGRVVSFSPKTAVAIDRYLRLRRKHALADWPNMWLGENSHGLSYVGLRGSILERAELAGIKHFHLHLLRHTAASRWLARGGSEQGLMTQAGWSNRSMLDRYSRAGASDRAMAEAETLGLGDL
jgi:site-specific recombinase XerD